MKVILSIDPVRYPLTGIGRYTYELAKNLKNVSLVEQLRFFAGRRFVNALPRPVESLKPASSPGFSLRKTILTIPFATQIYSRAISAAKRFELRGNSDFVFHGPNFYLPAFDGKMVCTFHDLSIFTWAHCHPPERVRYMRKEIALTLKRADMLITDTEFTRLEVASYFSWPLDKIRAVPLACSSEFRPRTDDEIIPVLNKYSLILRGYSLYVGTIEPRKNLASLLAAYKLLPMSIRRQWPLVLIGYRGWRSDDIHAQISAAAAEGWAQYLGFVEADDLPFIYSGARLFTFPSLYEGFGLPVLEAMASGVPVVCSNSSTLTEVAGDAAGYRRFEPIDCTRVGR